MELLASVIAAVVAWIVALFGMQAGAISYVAQDLIQKPDEATILFGGDLMFDRTIRTAMQQKGDDYVLSCLDPILRGNDAIVANLEGPITASSSISEGSSPGDDRNYTFTFATSTAELLVRHGIGIVSIGNNHMLDFSRYGLEQTKQYLSDAGVQYFGDPAAAESDRVLRTTIQGIPFSFVNWSDWNSDKTDHTVAQVRAEASTGRVVVVYTHWGEEYVEPLPRVRALAHQMVDAGASIVIGSHPHVVQEHEVYGGKDIYYSLGNLVFDQYWMDSVRNGLMLRVTFDASGVKDVEEIPVELRRDRTTCPKMDESTGR